MALKFLNALNPAGQIVLVRADLNVPMQQGQVRDDTRLIRLFGTLDYLTKGGAKVVLLSHFGRPKIGEQDPEHSLRAVAAGLAQLWGQGVGFASDCIGEVAQTAIASTPYGGVVVLENLRFHAGEEANDLEFTKALAALGNVYVNDAFSVAHRAHASVTGLPTLLPSYGGLQLEAELNALGAILESPKRPVAALIGGAKVSSKLALLENLVGRVQILIPSGGMANTFLAAKGFELGTSLVEKDLIPTAAAILDKAAKAGCQIILPKDVVCAARLADGVPTSVYDVRGIPADQMALDVGPATIAQLLEVLGSAKTILWNGPLGAFEYPAFAVGTVLVAQSVARAVRAKQCIAVAGGGDTVAALNAADVVNDFTYISTAGGAFLEWLEGKVLPGIQALDQTS